VQGIFWLLRAFLRLETERLRQRGVRVQIIGRRDRLGESELRAIETTEARTAAGTHLHLRVAIDYSSREAIARAAVAAASSGAASSKNALLSPDSLGDFLALAFHEESNDVDLLIRTGGEQRLSDFLLWESAYAELLFTDRMWPDFDEGDLDAALAEFRRRERRFGGLPATTSASATMSEAIAP
jgi:undecaprenyl diphosphate synthase